MDDQATQKNRVQLTHGRVAAFVCPDGKSQVFLRDTKQRGLAVRATGTGNKAYVFEGKLGGKTIRVTLGDPVSMSLEAARIAASETRLLVAGGRDPRVVKAERIDADAALRKKSKADRTPALEAWSAYIEARANKWSARYKSDHEDMSRAGGGKITRGRRNGMADTKEPGILRPLLDLPIKDITRQRVASWLDGETVRRPTRARLAISLLATFLNWCADRPEYSAQVQHDACTRMKKDLPAPSARDDCLQREQLALWFEHVRQIHNPVQAAYLQVLLLTGARRNELAGLRWDDVDFQWHSMTIHDKVEGARTIPLTPYVKQLLEGLRQARMTVRRINGATPEAGPHVFASPTSATGHITEPRIAHNKALAGAGLPALSLHGLRRSFGTLAEWVECPAGIVAQIMGHKPSAIAEKHYRRRPLDLLRMWHTKIEAWILEQAGIEQPNQDGGKVKVLTAA